MSGVNCREFEGALIEAARRGPLSTALATHLETCGECRVTMDRQKRLSAAAEALAREAARFTAPEHVERALMGELQSMRGGQRRRYVYGILGGAIAASLAVAWWMAYRPVPKVVVSRNVPAVATPVRQPVQPTLVLAAQSPGKRHVHAVPPAAPEQPFIAIPYTLPLEPYERADVVRMELPVAALIAAGVPTSMMDPGARAQADVLVGQDGRARAVRLIAVSTSN